MPEFLTPVDIGNRALQRVGSELMDATLGFAEVSKRAQQVGFNYGKLRRAELQRNIWTFATRRTALRPIDFNTMLLTPTLWDSVVTYFVGSVVQDAAGTLWESTQRNNLGNDPQNSPFAWIPYFGPMSVEQFQSQAFFQTTTVSIVSTAFLNTFPLSLGYFKSELVYTYKGDGSFNVYKSLIDGNAIHPALPNQWSITARYKQNDVVNVYPAWSSLTTYSQGQTVNVTDASGNVTTYSSLTNSNLNNPPASSAASWALMPTLVLQTEFNPANINQTQIVPGTSPINEWDVFTTYNIGNFVIWNATIYLSLINNNTGNYPSNASDWVACTGGTLYQSLVSLNQGNNPTTTPAPWSAVTSYSIGNMVGGSNGLIYTSLINLNLGNDPTMDNGTRWSTANVPVAWTTTFSLGGGNSLWIQIGGSAFPNGVGIIPLQLTYPIGSGPRSETWTKNVFRLPSGYLRKAPQNPKAGTGSWLGAPGNLEATDWSVEGNFMTTWESRAIVYRFVADVQNVTDFPDTFCEGLACRIALEVCEALTQSTAKVQIIGQEYRKFMTEAIQINAIEVGPITPPLDDFIACRA